MNFSGSFLNQYKTIALVALKYMVFLFFLLKFYLDLA